MSLSTSRVTILLALPTKWIHNILITDYLIFLCLGIDAVKYSELVQHRPLSMHILTSTARSGLIEM